MAAYNGVEANRCFIGKLDFGSDLLAQLTAVCEKEEISLGTVEAIGAVQKVGSTPIKLVKLSGCEGLFYF